MVFQGTYDCPKDGIFSWRFQKPDRGSVIVARVTDLYENCYSVELINGRYIAYIRCPVCHQTFHVDITTAE